MSWLTKQIQKQEWSPYAAGVLLGLVGILTVVFSHKLAGRLRRIREPGRRRRQGGSSRACSTIRTSTS